jgi:hypothetical protein
MMEDIMARILSTDWVCRYEDAGYDALIESLAPQGLEIAEFLEALNDAGSQPPMTEEMFLKYVIDRKASGRLETVDVRGASFPQHTDRPDAPTGLGGDADGVFFSSPTENLGEGITTIYWYVNGEKVASTSQDISSNRASPQAVADAAEAGDVIQIALVGDAVGWWARIEV